MENKKQQDFNLEKTITEQIIDAMISNLKKSEHFTDETLKELRGVGLSNKSSVKEVISKEN